LAVILRMVLSQAHAPFFAERSKPQKKESLLYTNTRLLQQFIIQESPRRLATQNRASVVGRRY
ncbi:hypothetical protein, partial [Pseudomonas chlororaphis]|uniref:hypothetical protein n=1 Tax=Pseudomonas chlororaphis TaxID=587753 RepID=UPI003C2806C3